MKVYPSTRYHPEHGAKCVKSAEEDAALIGWYHSPAEFGVETCPGKTPDPSILAVKQAIADKKIVVEEAAEPAPEVAPEVAPAKRQRKAKA